MLGLLTFRPCMSKIPSLAFRCVPQFTAFIMHHNEEIYQVAYIVPMVCFAVCAAYGIKVLKS
ncbi:MAG: hypothetical protein ACI4B3_01240 [Prevotella sp.]